MPKPIPTYQASGVPQGAAPLQAVDTRGVLDTLSRWQATEQDRMVQTAKRGAAEQGLLEGGAAAGQGRAPTVYAGDTEAERAWNEASRSAYLAGIENDWAETATRLSNEHALNPEKYAEAAQGAIQGGLKGLDRVTAEQARLRADAIFGREHRGILDQVAAKGRADMVASSQAALGRRLDDFLRAARKGDLVQGGQLRESMLGDLEKWEAAGVVPTVWAEAFRDKVRKEGTAESYFGDFEDARDKEAWLANFRKAAPEGLDPKEHEALVSRIESYHREALEADVLRASQEAEDAIFLRAADDPTEALRLAREIENPKVREKVVRSVKTRLDEQETLRKRERDERGRTYRQKVIDDPTSAQLSALEASALDLDPEDRAWAREWVAKKAKGEEPITDWALFAELSAESAENPAAFSKRDLTRVRGRMSDEEFKSLTGFQRTAENELRRKAERAEDKAAASAKSADEKKENREREERERRERFALTHVNEVVASTAAGAGIEKTKNPKRWGALYERVWRWAEVAQPTTRQEVQDYTDSLLLKSDGGWFGKDRFLFEQPGKAPKVAEIPPAWLPELRKRLTAKGQRITAENMQKLWDATLEKEAAGAQK